MKKVLFLILVFSISAFAGVPTELGDMKCKKEVEKVLKQSGSSDEWVAGALASGRDFVFKSTTDKFAQWVEVHGPDDPIVFVMNTKKTKTYKWSSKNCQKVLEDENQPFEFLKKLGSKAFTDSDLKSLVISGKKYMVYIWSPMMSYSIHEMPTFQKVAKKLGVEFVPVLDFYEDGKKATELLKHRKIAAKINKFNSLDLHMRDGAVHFPTTFIVSNEQISSKIFGVVPEELLTQNVKDRMQENKERSMK